MIQAIETRYRGYKFRSRLEARYAVFLDTLGIEWEYEREGFDLGKLGWYLPDFWLPRWQVWLEIKGEFIHSSHEDYKKVEYLGQHQRPVILSCGNIGDECLTLFAHDSSPSGGGCGDYNGLWMIKDDRIGIACDDAGWLTILDGEGNFLRWIYECDDRPEDPRLTYAYRAARSARFEHGEQP